MKKNWSLLTILSLLLAVGCSSMPKDERSQNVNTARAQSVLQLERGNNEYRWNNFESALVLYDRALTQASSVDWLEGIVRSMVQISRTLDQLGRNEDAYQYALTAADFQESASSAALRVLTLNRMAEWHFFQDDLQGALAQVDQAIAAGRGLESEEAGETWRIKAAVHKRQKEYDAALEAISEAIKIDDQGIFLAELASDYYIQSSIYSLSGRYSEAVAAMEAALEKDKFIENSAGIAMDLYGLGKIHEKNGNTEKALAYYKRLYLVYRATDNRTVPDFLIESINSLSETESWLPEFDSP